MNARCGAVEPPPLEAEDEKRRERDDSEVEVEPGQVPERPLRHLAGAVVLGARRLVGAEHRERRAAAQRLGDDRHRGDAGHGAVEDAEAAQAAPPEQ